MDNQELAGKVAFVTGAANGIGKAIALRLAAAGCKIAINDLPGTGGASGLVAEIEREGGEASLALASVVDSPAVKAVIDQVVERWGKIDILVNNAGIAKENLVLRISDDDWDRVMDTNLKGAFLCTRNALRSMLGLGWGRIINMASVAGIKGNMGLADYSASKGGLIAFTRSLAAELGSRNVTVNAIAPGMISTRLTEDLPDDMKERVLSRTILRRLGTPQEVAELAAFLASDRAGYITGQVICIDGGVT
jgi:3-oxoacyl-[acyl-carrier protein] reductase